MKRLFWVALGITLGVLTMRKISAAAEKLTPQGIANSIGAGLSELATSIGEFAADVRDAMGEREEQLRSSTGLDGRLGRAPAEQQAQQLPPPPARRPGPRPGPA